MNRTSVTSRREFERLEKLYEFSKLTPAVIDNSSKKWLREWQQWAQGCERCTWSRSSDDATFSELPPGEIPPAEPTHSELVTLAALAHQALGWTVRGEAWPVARNADVFLTETGRYIVAKRREDSFLFGAHEIVGAARKSLRQCARNGCSEIYVAWKKKRFCSDQCAQSARKQESRDKRRFKNLIKDGATEAEAAKIVARFRAERVAEHNARLDRVALAPRKRQLHAKGTNLKKKSL